MKSQVKQLTQVVAFKPITLEIQIESLEELRVLRALWGASTTVSQAICSTARHMESIRPDCADRILSATFAPIHVYHESLK